MKMTCQKSTDVTHLQLLFHLCSFLSIKLLSLISGYYCLVFVLCMHLFYLSFLISEFQATFCNYFCSKYIVLPLQCIINNFSIFIKILIIQCKIGVLNLHCHFVLCLTYFIMLFRLIIFFPIVRFLLLGMCFYIS